MHTVTATLTLLSNVSLEADDYGRIKSFVESLEARKLRMFHRELNIWAEDPCCMEFSFVMLDWTNWNSAAKFALPPL